MLLARARGLDPVQLAVPPTHVALPTAAFLEVRLVWDRAARHYTWHLVVEDGRLPDPPAPGGTIAAVDLGEIVARLPSPTLPQKTSTVALGARLWRSSPSMPMVPDGPPSDSAIP